MPNNLNLVMEAFNRLFNRTQQEITFNLNWLTGTKSAGGAVHHLEHRIILPHGQVVKSVDSNKRRVLLIGSEYGLIAINESYHNSDPCRPLQYTITPALASIWESYKHIHVPTADYMHAPNVPDFCSVSFLQEIAQLAELERKMGRTPGDGMRKYITSKKKEDNPKQIHGRRHIDDQCNAQFKLKKKEVAVNQSKKQFKPKAHRPPKHVPIAKAMSECAAEARALA